MIFVGMIKRGAVGSVASINISNGDWRLETNNDRFCKFDKPSVRTRMGDKKNVIRKNRRRRPAWTCRFLKNKNGHNTSIAMNIGIEVIVAMRPNKSVVLVSLKLGVASAVDAVIV